MSREDWLKYRKTLPPCIIRALRIEKEDTNSIQFLHDSICSFVCTYRTQISICKVMLGASDDCGAWCDQLIFQSDGRQCRISMAKLVKGVAQKCQALSVLPLPIVDEIWHHFAIIYWEGVDE